MSDIEDLPELLQARIYQLVHRRRFIARVVGGLFIVPALVIVPMILRYMARVGLLHFYDEVLPALVGSIALFVSGIVLFAWSFLANGYVRQFVSLHTHLVWIYVSSRGDRHTLNFLLDNGDAVALPITAEDIELFVDEVRSWKPTVVIGFSEQLLILWGRSPQRFLLDARQITAPTSIVTTSW